MRSGVVAGLAGRADLQPVEQMIVVVEGIDGAGKSTVLQHVAEDLARRRVSSILIDKHNVSMETELENRRIDCVRELIWGIETPTGIQDKKTEAYFKYLIIAAWYRLLADFIVISMVRKPGEVLLLDGWYFRHIIKTHLRTGIGVDDLYAIIKPMVAAVDVGLKIFLDTSPEAAATRKDFSDHEVGYLDGFEGGPRRDAFVQYQSNIRRHFLREFPEFRVIEEAEKRTALGNAELVVNHILKERSLSSEQV